MFSSPILLNFKKPNFVGLQTTKHLHQTAGGGQVTNMGSCKAQRCNADKLSCFYLFKEGNGICFVEQRRDESKSRLFRPKKICKSFTSSQCLACRKMSLKLDAQNLQPFTKFRRKRADTQKEHVFFDKILRESSLKTLFAFINFYFLFRNV